MDLNDNTLQQWNDITCNNQNSPDLFLAKFSKSILLEMDSNLVKDSHKHSTISDAKNIGEYAGIDNDRKERKESIVRDPNVNIQVSRLNDFWMKNKKTLDRIQIVPLSTQMLLADRTKMQLFIKKVCSAVNTITELHNPCDETSMNGFHAVDGNDHSMNSFVAPDAGVHSFHVNGITELYQNGTEGQHETRKAYKNSEDRESRKHSHDNELNQNHSVRNGTDIGNHKRTFKSKWKTVLRQPNHIVLDSNDLGSISKKLNFPLVVKSTRAMEKKMAVVPTMECLLHFRKERLLEVPGIELVVEEYIPHNNTVLKVGLIGKQVFVVRRPSIPDIHDFQKENLTRLSNCINGKFVEVGGTDSKVDGYLTFESMTTKREKCLASQRLDECTDLDIFTINKIVHILSRSLQLKLLGVDILVSTQGDSMHLIDINAFPGFSDIENKDAIILNYLEDEARKRAFVTDSHKLACNELLEFALDHNKLWKKAMVSAGDMCLKTIRKNRIYEIHFEGNDADDDQSPRFGGEIHPKVQVTDATNHKEKKADKSTNYHNGCNTSKMHNGIWLNTAMLFKFRNFRTPGRMISDKLKFDINISKQLQKHGLGPGGMSVISATYFGKTTEVGFIRDWVHGLPLKNYLQQYKSEHSLEFLRKLFQAIGVNVARFHQILSKLDFHDNFVKHHFPGNLGFRPVAPVRFNVWQQEAMSLLEMSDMSDSETWKHFYQKLISDLPCINDFCQNIIMSTESSEANALVFGHFDCNVSNIIVSKSAEDQVHTCLIDEEWACPNMAVYDFGKLVSSVIMMMKREETILRKNELEELVRELSVYYLKSMSSKAGSEQKETVEFNDKDKLGNDNDTEDEELASSSRFSRDIWRFTAYAALVNSYSNLIHASKDGQLSSIEEDFQLTLASSGDFNWLRHAYDHYLIFREYMEQ